jgi:hypothetical protein
LRSKEDCLEEVAAGVEKRGYEGERRRERRCDDFKI